MALLNKRGKGMPKGLPANKKLLLHVGCGTPDPDGVPEPFRGPDWHEVRYDIDPGVGPDIVGSIVDMSPVPSESMDAVYSSHNLEHVYAHEAVLVLSEFLRVLRPGGEVLLTMPDLQQVAEHVVAGRLEDPFYVGPSGSLTPLDMLYGMGDWIAKGNEFMAHRTGYTTRTLERRLRQAGFGEVVVQARRDDIALWASARRPLHPGN
jgi:SAM-dependent methyltransferase